MSISYPLTVPTVGGPKGLYLRPVSVVGAAKAPFSGKETIYAHQGKWLEAELTFPMMTRATADPWLALFDSLNGKEGTFIFGDPQRTQPRGAYLVAPGVPQVDGGGQSGTALNIKTGLSGIIGGTPGYLKAGSFLQLGSDGTTRLHRIGADVDLDVDGKAAVRIFPQLRYSPANNATVTLIEPKGLWRLSINNVGAHEDEVGNVQIDVVPIIEAMDFT